MSAYILDGPATIGDTSTYSSIKGIVGVGGISNTATQTGDGSVNIGGSSNTISIVGDGDVAISSSGTVGSSSTDTNLVLIGGTNTTLYGSGSVSIGPSSQTVLYQPTNPKLYIKDSPVITKLNTVFTTPGTLTASAVSGGIIQFTTTAGAYTLPTTAAICSEILDTSATIFSGSPRHFFQVTFYNITGGIVTLATNTGQTLTNGSSPVSIQNNESRTWNFWFTSPTAILIEDMSITSAVTLTNAGTTSLVNDGIGPDLATKGLVAGTGISFSTTSTDVTITNDGVTSITGTTNQVIASSPTGAVTLSLPQDIATTSTPTFNEVTITGTVTNATDAATKAYVDSIISTTNIHAPCEAATTTNLNAFYTNGTLDASGGLGIGATLTSNVNQDINTAAIIDGYTSFIIGSRVLIKNQSSAIANGIYDVTDLGSGSTPWILTRSSDYDDSTANQVTAGDLTFVSGGSTQASTSWVQTSVGTGTSPPHIIIGTDNITWTQTSGSGTYTAGVGLTLAGNQFSLTVPVTPANGGTGTTTAPIAGDVLIGTSGGVYTPATLTNGTAISITSASGSITINNTGVTSLTGTSNEIVVSASTGAVTLSLPSNVIISNSLTVSGLTPDSFLYSSTAGLLATTAPPTDGQLLIGSTGLAPVIGNITAGAGISVTNGAGTISIANTGIISISEPFYTSNSRAIISGSSNTLTNVSSTSGGGLFGGISNNPTINATTGGVTIAGSTFTGTLSGNGSAILGSSGITSTVSGTGAAIVGGSAGSANITATGAVRVGGVSLGSIGSAGAVMVGGNGTGSATIGASSSGAVYIGGNSMSLSISSSLGGVVVGGNSWSGSLSANGAAILAGNSSVLSITGNGGAVVGGNTCIDNVTGTGAVNIGGDTLTRTSAGNGNVIIAAAGTTGSATTDTNLVLIGGTSTTLNGLNSICIGPSSQTVLYQPSSGKLYLKDNPVSTKLNTTFTTPGTLTAAAISGGIVQFTTTAGAYTLPTTAALCTAMLDSTATAFTGTPRHFFQVTFYNNTAGACTIALGTGQTLTNGTSPISIANGESRTWSFWFTSPTTMLIEDMKSGANGNSSFAEPFFTTNSRAIIAGSGGSFTGVNSTSQGASIGGFLSIPTISSGTGSVSIAGGNTSSTYTLGGQGNASIGGYDQSFNITGEGDVVVGGIFVSSSISGAGHAIVGSISCSTTFSGGNGNVITGGSGLASTMAGNGNVRIGGQTSAPTINGDGNVVVGGQDMSTSSIAATTFGAAIVGGRQCTYTFPTASHGSVSVGGYTSTASITSCYGAVTIGSQSNNITFTANSHGAVSVGGNTNTTSLRVSGAVAIGGNTVASILSTGTGSVVIGGSSTTAVAITGTGAVCIGGSGVANTSALSGSGAVSIGGNNNATISGSGAVLVGGSSSTCTLSTNSVTVGGSGNSTNISNSGVVVGGISNAGTMAGTGTVRVGGTSNLGTMAGTGGVVIGGSAVTPSLGGGGNVTIGGATVTDTTSGNGSVIIGGSGSSNITVASNGAIVLSGNANTLTVNGNGCVGIAASGTIGSATTDTDLVLIGGSGTTLQGTSASVCIGALTTTQTFSPSSPQTFIKNNPLSGFTISTITTGTTLTAAQLLGGYIHISSGGLGTTTFPSATSIYTAGVDSASGFSLNMSFMFVIRNTSGATVTLAAGTNNTLQGTTGTIAGTASRAGIYIFLTATTGLIFLFG